MYEQDRITVPQSCAGHARTVLHPAEETDTASVSSTRPSAKDPKLPQFRTGGISPAHGTLQATDLFHAHAVCTTGVVVLARRMLAVGVKVNLSLKADLKNAKCPQLNHVLDMITSCPCIAGQVVQPANWRFKLESLPPCMPKGLSASLAICAASCQQLTPAAQDVAWQPGRLEFERYEKSAGGLALTCKGWSLRQRYQPPKA